LKELVETKGCLKFITLSELLPDHQVQELRGDRDQLCRILGKSVSTAKAMKQRRVEVFNNK
jgi:hypothetical protein